MTNTDARAEDTAKEQRPRRRDVKARRHGQIIRRGDRKFLVRILIGDDPQTGRRIYFNKTLRCTLKEAEAWMTRAKSRRDQGLSIEEQSAVERPFAAYLDVWLKEKTKTVRPRSLEIYQQNVDQHIRPALGGLETAKIVAGDVRTFYDNLSEKGLSGRTIGLVHTVLTNVFGMALENDIVSVNPMAKVKPPRVETREMRAMTGEQVRAFIKAADEGAHGCVLAFLLMTGCRPGEAQAVKWADVSFEAGTVTIQRNLVRLAGGVWQFGPPKTESGRRTIPLSANLLARLRAHEIEQAKARREAGAAWAGLDLMICNAWGSPYCHDFLTDVWKETLRRAGLPIHFRVYDARHTVASLLMAEGVSAKIVQERLGHASVAITLKVYSHTSPGMQEKATERLDQVIFG